MNLASHLSSLYAKKSQLEVEIQTEMNRPQPNFLRISELKRKKMAVKIEITSIEDQEKVATS